MDVVMIPDICLSGVGFEPKSTLNDTDTGVEVNSIKLNFDRCQCHLMILKLNLPRCQSTDFDIRLFQTLTPKYRHLTATPSITPDSQSIVGSSLNRMGTYKTPVVGNLQFLP